MALYIKSDDVKIRLTGKVRFTDALDDENKMSEALLKRLINEAEGDVEHDLSVRYAAPFQTDQGAPFNSLPERPTKEILRTMCELKAVMRVLETDFGRGTAVSGDEYYKSQEKRYDAMLAKHIDKKKYDGAETSAWKFPPLPGLRLNYHNTEADDGFAGQILTTSSHTGDFPQAQINDPSQTFWNGTVSVIDKDGFE